MTDKKRFLAEVELFNCQGKRFSRFDYYIQSTSLSGAKQQIWRRNKNSETGSYQEVKSLTEVSK